MAKLILICGKLCSGKTTYTKTLPAINLSVDELMLSLLDPFLGERHEVYTARSKDYLLQKTEELLANGVDVVLDWGFWKASERKSTRQRFETLGYTVELHYLPIPSPLWKSRIEARNAAILRGEMQAYYVDENLLRKFEAMFDPPSQEEIDVLLPFDALEVSSFMLQQPMDEKELREHFLGILAENRYGKPETPKRIKCGRCKNRAPEALTCPLYPDGIPDNVLLEKELCPEFSEK